jgi:hypothetical protein
MYPPRNKHNCFEKAKKKNRVKILVDHTYPVAMQAFVNINFGAVKNALVDRSYVCTGAA